MLWTDIQVRILSGTGHLFVPTSGVVEDPGIYDLNETDGFDIGLYYISIRGDEYVGARDSFKLTGLTTAFEQAIVEFYYKGKFIGDVVLQTEFP